MGLNRPTQQLRRQLLDMSNRQKDVARRLFKALDNTDAALFTLMLTLMDEAYREADSLRDLADEVRDGMIERKKVDA